MNIAMVGGGKRGARLIEVIEQHTFREIDPKIIAVADLKKDAPGILKAKSQGLFVTDDYNAFFERDDIDLIIDMTGSMDIYNDILGKKSKDVRAISTKTAQLFWEISRVSVQQKLTDQKLQETQAMYKIFKNDLLQEDVMVISHNYRILDINKPLLTKLGLSRDETIGRYCYEITHHQNSPCTGENHPCPLIETMSTKKPSQTTHIHLDQKGREIYYSISTFPLLEGEDVIGAVEIGRDITKDIKVQKLMMQQEKLASIGRLSAGVAHEINNPLTTILTSAMLIQEDLEPDDPIFQELETISSETLRCRKIVSSLLDFARQTKPQKKRGHINDVVKESVILTRKQAAFTDITITSILAEDIPDIYLDVGQIQQALINLIFNAVEATQPGGWVTVTTSCDPGNSLVDVTIKDNGAGIAEKDLGKIFDPFFTTKEDGNGLGLAITHGIIKQHGGTIEVKSKLGEGTQFKIRLPSREKDD
jgi:PAS domain S-box-containing protein